MYLIDNQTKYRGKIIIKPHFIKELAGDNDLLNM